AARADRAHEAALIGGGTRRTTTARWRGVAGFERRAVHAERLRRRRADVESQYAELRRLPQDVAGRVADDAAAGGVADQVVALGHERPAEAARRVAVGMRGAVPEIEVAGDDRVAQREPRRAGSDAAAPGSFAGVVRNRDVVQIRDAELVVGDAPAAAAGVVAADGHVDQRQRAVVVDATALPR